MLDLSNRLQEKEEKLRVEFLSLNHLIRLIGEFLGVEFKNVSRGSGEFISEVFETQKIEGVFLKALKNNNFSLNYRDDGVITLSDDNRQKLRVGFCPSNYWNFRNREGEPKDPLIFEIRVEVHMDGRERGVYCYPRVTGPFLSPCDHLPQWRVFGVLANIAESNKSKICKKVIYDITQSEQGVLFVPWCKISNSFRHLSGIRSISNLFAEFVGDKKMVWRLVSRGFRSEIFSFDDEQKFFAPEHLHLEIFSLWKEELDLFISELKIN